jgi:hypothetical protein
MSIGNPKKFRFTEGLEKKEVENKNAEADIDDIARVHKDKNYKVKKELSFQTKNNTSKLA